MPLRCVALVKQTPRFEAMELGPDGRLVREGLPLEMSAYCRRAVAQAVALVAEHGGDVTVLTMGPPSARDVLREALTYADEHGVPMRAVHLCDPALSGSDTLATARALAAAVGIVGRDHGVDLVLSGRTSVDADTGQVGPQVAQLLGLPFLTGVKQAHLDEGDGALTLVAGCELDDLWEDATVVLPAAVSVAERLIDPCKITDPELWVASDDGRIDTWTADDLGAGPWGEAGSPTRVGAVRTIAATRAGRILDGPVADQVAEVVALLAARGLVGSTVGTAPDEVTPDEGTIVASTGDRGGPQVAVVAEPGRERLTRELTAAAAGLAASIGGAVTVLGAGLDPADAPTWGSWGADHLVVLEPMGPGADPSRLGDPVDVGAIPAEDVSDVVSGWVGERAPWAVLAGGTPWGREVASRVAAAHGAGLTGDAVELEVDADGRLVAWKPAFGGAMVVAIHCSTPIQLVTVRRGVLALPAPRSAPAATVTRRELVLGSRVVIEGRRREDDVDAMAAARRVVGVGQGVPAERYGEIVGLLEVLGAEVAATRKVTDAGWLPHARQLGITGHVIAPDLYVALGTSGKYNHMVGVRTAGTVVAVNTDPAAPVFGFADIGVVGDWAEVVAELEHQLRALDP